MHVRRLLGILALVVACEPKTTTSPDDAGAAQGTAEPEPAPADEDGDEAETASRPPPVEQVLEIDGKLTKAAVDQAVQEHAREFRACFDEALQHPDDVELTGAIVVRFVVTPAGEAENPIVELSEFGDKPTESCVAAAVDGLGFPKQKAESTVHLPLYANNF